MSGEQLRNAAILGSYTTLSHLLRHGANPCSVDSSSSNNGAFTALHYAIWNRHSDCIKLLLANDIGKHPIITGESSVSCLDFGSKYTPLHIAVRSKSIENVRMLVLAGADASLRDWERNTPLEIVLQKKKEYPNDNTIWDAMISLLETVPSQDDMDLFRRDQIEPHVVRRRRHHSPTASYDEKIPPPKELSRKEHLMVPSALRLMKEGRKNGAEVIRNLVELRDEAETNVERRRRLANCRERGL